MALIPAPAARAGARPDRGELMSAPSGRANYAIGQGLLRHAENEDRVRHATAESDEALGAALAAGRAQRGDTVVITASRWGASE